MRRRFARRCARATRKPRASWRCVLLRSQSTGWTRGRLEVMVLQCVAERMRGESAEHLLREFATRRQRTAWRACCAICGRLPPSRCATRRGRRRLRLPRIASQPVPAEAQAVVVQSGLLTAKEREVLALLVAQLFEQGDRTSARRRTDDRQVALAAISSASSTWAAAATRCNARECCSSSRRKKSCNDPGGRSARPAMPGTVAIRGFLAWGAVVQDAHIRQTLTNCDRTATVR